MINRIEQKIATHYGVENQLRLLQEEAAELSVAISKYFRYGEDENLVEELADVQLVMSQIMSLMGVEDRVADMRRYKANRTLMRIEGID